MRFISKYQVRTIDVLFYFFILCYCFLIIFNTNYYNPIDEMAIQEGFKIDRWYGILPSQFSCGRFQILNGLDIYLIHQLFGNKLIYCYTLIAIQFAITIYLVAKILKRLNIFNLYTLVFLISMCISNYTNIYFRLLCPERYVFMFFALTTYLILLMSDSNKYNYYLLIVLLATNISMYYKETAFVLPLILGVGILIINRKNKFKQRILSFFATLFILSCIIYLILYYKYVFLITTDRYGIIDISFFKNVILTLCAWFINDPILIVVFVPIVIYRIYVNISNRFSGLSIYDCLGFAGLLYMTSFFILKLYASYYFIPVYALSIPIIFSNSNYINSKKYLLVLCLLLQLGNSTIGVNEILFQRYEHKNFDIIVNELNKICKQNKNKRTNIYVLGGQYFDNNMFFQISAKLLEKGNTYHSFDLMSYENITKENQLNIINAPFAFMHSNIKRLPQKGDYILYTPYTRLDINKLQEQDLIEIKSLAAPSYLANYNFQYIAKQILYILDPATTVETNRSVRNGSYYLYQYNGN